VPPIGARIHLDWGFHVNRGFNLDGSIQGQSAIGFDGDPIVPHKMETVWDQIRRLVYDF